MVEGMLKGEDRLRRAVRRLRWIADDYDREKEEAQRRETEAAERKARVARGWRTLKAKRQQILGEVNSALKETGFKLHMSSDIGVLKDDEIDYLLIDFRGKEHPTLGQMRLRVALKQDGMVVADVITDTKWRRLRRVTYEEFTLDAWRDLLVEHLDMASSEEDDQTE